MISAEKIRMDGAKVTGPLLASGEGAGISLIVVVTELARRKELIAKITGVAIALGLMLCLVLPNRYTATTKIMTPQQTPSISYLLMNQSASGAGVPLAAIASGGLGLKNPNDLYLGLLGSRPVADIIIRKFDLMKLYNVRDMTAARRKLASRTTIATDKSGLIIISVIDGDRQRAASIANEYTAQLRALTQNLAMTEAAQRRLFYEGQLDRAKEALVLAETAFQQVQLKKGMVALDAQAKAMIEGQASLRAQVAAKKVQLQAMRSYSTDRNPSVQMAEQELASLQEQEARVQQSNHSSQFAQMGLLDIPVAGSDYLRAQHELAYRQTLYDLLIRQYDAARLDEAKEAAIIQIVEPAIEPDRKSSPKFAIILALAAAIGFVIGCATALGVWWKDVESVNPAVAVQFEALRSAVAIRIPKRL
jgi:tyrosine-protein kinase Etk/Wzc